MTQVLNSRKLELTIISASLAMFFLLPVVPYTKPSDQFAFLGQKATANVSSSYVLTLCGIVNNPMISSSVGNIASHSNAWSGARWVCGTSWTQPQTGPTVVGP